MEGWYLKTVRIALYQPEIPQNTGTLLRLGACLNVGLDIIEPCGFVFSDQRLQRSGMDYIQECDYRRHPSWVDFYQNCKTRLILLTPAAQTPYYDFAFQSDDTLLLGRESDGVPSDVATLCPYHLQIPMIPRRRSINIAIAASMVLGEALRQIKGFPHA